MEALRSRSTFFAGGLVALPLLLSLAGVVVLSAEAEDPAEEAEAEAAVGEVRALAAEEADEAAEGGREVRRLPLRGRPDDPSDCGVAGTRRCQGPTPRRRHSAQPSALRMSACAADKVSTISTPKEEVYFSRTCSIESGAPGVSLLVVRTRCAGTAGSGDHALVTEEGEAGAASPARLPVSPETDTFREGGRGGSVVESARPRVAAAESARGRTVPLAAAAAVAEGALGAGAGMSVDAPFAVGCCCC